MAMIKLVLWFNRLWLCERLQYNDIVQVHAAYTWLRLYNVLPAHITELHYKNKLSVINDYIKNNLNRSLIISMLQAYRI